MSLKSSFALFAILCSNLGSVSAGQVTIDAVPPTVDGDDIAQLDGAADAGGDQGHLWSNRPHQGQSFTTGPSPSGYVLTSVTLQNLNNTITAAPTFNLQIGTLTAVGSPETFTQVGSTETAVAPNYVPLDYITFTFDTPLTLDPNTLYAFLWGSGSQGFVTVNNLDDSTYSGGTAISSGDNNVPDYNNVVLRGVDRVFHLDLESVATADQDGDGLPSSWEVENGLDPDDNGENPNNNGVAGDPDNGPSGDPDMDGLDNLGELNRATDPQDADSDDDTLSDLVETNTGIFVDAMDTGSNPNLADTDSDGISDPDEIAANPQITDPNNPDTDGDSVSDFDELEADPFVTDPLSADTDGDGFGDGVELAAGSDPTRADDVPGIALMFVASSPPVVDGDDIAQLVGQSDIGADQGHAWSNRPRQGQSFTTGSDPGGYALTSVTFRAQVNQASTLSDNWELRFGSIDEGGIITPQLTQTFTGVTIPNGIDNWVTWSFSAPLQLDPDTTYGFDIFPDGGGFISLGEVSDVFADGSAYSAGSPGSTVFPESPPEPVTTHESDHAFHVNLSASGGGGFRFTEIVIVDTPDGPAVRLTWDSRTGATYIVDASTDLADWSGEVDDSIPSGGESTTIERLIANLPAIGPRIYFRVRLGE